MPICRQIVKCQFDSLTHHCGFCSIIHDCDLSSTCFKKLVFQKSFEITENKMIVKIDDLKPLPPLPCGDIGAKCDTQRASGRSRNGPLMGHLKGLGHAILGNFV